MVVYQKHLINLRLKNLRQCVKNWWKDCHFILEVWANSSLIIYTRTNEVSQKATFYDRQISKLSCLSLSMHNFSRCPSNIWHATSKKQVLPSSFLKIKKANLSGLTWQAFHKFRFSSLQQLQIVQLFQFHEKNNFGMFLPSFQWHDDNKIFRRLT